MPVTWDAEIQSLQHGSVERALARGLSTNATAPRSRPAAPSQHQHCPNRGACACRNKPCWKMAAEP